MLKKRKKKEMVAQFCNPSGCRSFNHISLLLGKMSKVKKLGNPHTNLCILHHYSLYILVL